MSRPSGLWRRLCGRYRETTLVFGQAGNTATTSDETVEWTTTEYFSSTWMRLCCWLRGRCSGLGRSSRLSLASLRNTPLTQPPGGHTLASKREFCLDNVKSSDLPFLLQTAARCSDNRADMVPPNPVCVCVKLAFTRRCHSYPLTRRTNFV